MNIVDVFLIFAISVVSIEISSQDETFHHFRRIGKEDADYSEFERHMRNLRITRNEGNEENEGLGKVTGFPNADSRTYRGFYPGSDRNILTVMNKVMTYHNISRVILLTRSGTIFDGVYRDRRVPYNVIPLGLGPSIADGRGVFSLPHDHRQGDFPFYGSQWTQWFQSARPHRVELGSPDGSIHNYQVFYNDGVEGGSSGPLTNQERRVDEREAGKQIEGRKISSSKSKKEGIIQGFKYGRLFSPTSKAGSSAGSSSSRSDKERRKGKKKAEEKEEEK